VGNHENDESPSAAFGRNQEKGRKISGQKNRRLWLRGEIPEASFFASDVFARLSLIPGRN
jgi:hypothetical protein